MALNGNETLEVRGQNPSGVPASSVFTTTTQAIANLAGAAGPTSILTYGFAINSADQDNSMCHIAQGDVEVGQFIQTEQWYLGYDYESGGLYRVAEARGTIYGGTNGGFSSDGYVEGLWYRFEPILVAGNFIDIRTLGVQCAATVSGFMSRMGNIADWARGQQITLTAAGELYCTETVDLTNVFFAGEHLRFQGGIAQTTTGNFGPSFYTTTYTNREITFTTGSPVVVNLIAHGFVAGDSFMFGCSAGGKLPGSIEFLKTYYVKTVLDADTFTISATDGGAAINATTAFSGDYYLFQGGTQSGIETIDFVLNNGVIARKGIVVKGGAAGASIRDHMKQRLVVRGDGNFDWTTSPSTIGVNHDGDRGPHGRYDYSSNYSYVAAGSNTEYEKHEVHLRSTYSRYAWCAFKPAPGAGTPDSMDVYLSLANYEFAYYEAEGLDSYIKIHVRAEPRQDPENSATNEAGDGAPCFLVRNGKCTVFDIFMRGHNGRNCFNINAGANSSGSSARWWADTVFFTAFTAIHGYGTILDIQGARGVAGVVNIKDWSNPNGAGQAAQPCIKLGAISNAAGLSVYARSIRNVVGIEVGGGDKYSADANLGKYSIDMGDLAQFSTAGVELRGASGNPTTLDAWSFVKGKNCIIDLSGCRGKGTVGANVTENCKIILDNNAVDYTLTTTSGCVANIDTGNPKPRTHIAAGAATLSHLDSVLLINKTSGAATTVNLPSNPLVGRVYSIKDDKGDAAANNITITPASGNIDGAGTYVISTNYGKVNIMYSGTQWLSV